MSDLDDDELKATRILNGADKDKIEVGECVRIDKSSRFLGIGKVIRIVGNTIYLKMYIDLPISFSKEEIKECKHSKNIIELIEEGDYVNGNKILDINEINNKNKKVFTIFKNGKSEFANIWGNEDIKSIVTKEQFNSVKYVIPEEK